MCTHYVNICSGPRIHECASFPACLRAFVRLRLREVGGMVGGILVPQYCLRSRARFPAYTSVIRGHVEACLGHTTSSRVLYIYLYLYLYLYLYVYVSLSLSLSLSIHIYIYTYRGISTTSESVQLERVCGRRSWRASS